MPTVPGVALPAAAASTAPVSSEADGPAYSGQIVDYNEDKGFGFIECKDTQQIYGLLALEIKLPVQRMGRHVSCSVFSRDV